MFLLLTIKFSSSLSLFFVLRSFPFLCSFSVPGDVTDIGGGEGKYYSVNFPLKAGIGDEAFLSIFRPVIDKIMTVYRPGAVVLQCGADSLTGDRLGCFNLTLKGHGACVRHVRSYNVPTLVLGGGGYTIRNVARCWAYETAVCLGEEPNNQVPANDYFEYYAPDYQLHLQPSEMVNMNSQEYLDKYKVRESKKKKKKKRHGTLMLYLYSFLPFSFSLSLSFLSLSLSVSLSIDIFFF